MSANGNGNGKHVMDLDALYGEQEPLTVKWKGKEYPIARTDALGPKALFGLTATYGSANKLKNIGEKITDAQAKELETLMNTVLKMVAPTLPLAEMPFAARTKTLEWYFHEVNPPSAEKKMNRKDRRTMAKSSRRSRSGITSRSAKLA